MGNCLHRGPQLRNREGACLPGLLRQMEGSGNGAHIIKLIWASFLWIQIMLRVSVWGQSGTSVKELGSHELLSEYRAKRTGFKA